jgi:hypothetical protein
MVLLVLTKRMESREECEQKAEMAPSPGFSVAKKCLPSYEDSYVQYFVA